MTLAEIIDIIKHRYVYVAHLERIYDFWTKKFYGLTAIARLYYPADPLGTTIGYLLGEEVGMIKVDTVTFEPGGEQIVHRPNGVYELNLWTPTGIEPRTGDVTLFHEHLRFILDDDVVAFQFVLFFMAHMLQKPAEKMHFALLIIGGQGIGKSLIAEFLSILIGLENTAFIDMGMLSSQFNGFLSKSHLVVVNEFSSGASRSVRSLLKNLITAPILFANEKGIPAIQIANRTNLLMLSNDADAANIDGDDRRHFVWHSQALKRDAEYYTRLVMWFNAEGKHAVLDHLLTLDLSNFNPHAAPPKTAARAALVRESMSDQEQTLTDLYEAGEAPFEQNLAVIGDVVEHLNARRGLRFTLRHVSAFFRTIGAQNLGQCRMRSNNGTERKPHVWALVNAAQWLEASENDIAHAYATPGMPQRVKPEMRRAGLDEF